MPQNTGAASVNPSAIANRPGSAAGRAEMTHASAHMPSALLITSTAVFSRNGALLLTSAPLALMTTDLALQLSSPWLKVSGTLRGTRTLRRRSFGRSKRADAITGGSYRPKHEGGVKSQRGLVVVRPVPTWAQEKSTSACSSVRAHPMTARTTAPTILYSQFCQYALRATVHIAAAEMKDPDAWVPQEALARELGITRESVAQVNHRLRRAGLLSGRRGPSGGVGLARPADEITASDVIYAIDGAGLAGRCILGRTTCSDQEPCSLHATWSAARTQLERGFEQSSLAELVRASGPQRTTKETQMARNVFTILDDLAAAIEELRDALAPLAALSGAASRGEGPRRRGRPARATKPALAPAPATPEKKTKRSSPKLRALRQLQGKFLGALRGLNPEQREQIKKVRDEKGYEAALKAAAALRR